MERLVIIVNDWKPLTIIKKRSILGFTRNLVQDLMSLVFFPERIANKRRSEAKG